ncbi:DUF6531 domain-containing protein, partial [Methylobacterium indicum]|uniref:DUF6531 domain-containing protein n=1 Tax=Methylobacterium indicum TaxID=1775910 RepID=UPI0006546C11
MADIIRTTDPGADAKYGQPSGTVYGYDPSVGKYTQTGAPNPEGTLPDGSERLGEIGVNQRLDPVSPTRDLHRPEVETKKAEPKPDKTDGNPPQNAPGQFRTKKPERKSTWQKLKDKAEAAKQAAADFHLGTRALGVVQGVQSTVLGAGAGAAAVATAPSVIGAVGFGAAALNEFDQAVAGFRTAWTGEPTDTLVQTAAKWGATAAGVAPEQVEQVGEATGLLQGVIGANPSVAASKAATREAERLAQKEAQAAAEAPPGKSGKSETTTEGQTKDNVKVEEEQPKQGERQKDADCKGCITNPVQVSNGANRYAEIEFALPGPLPFDLTRSYNSAVGTIGPLGRGMRSSLDRAVVRHADGRLVYRDADHRDVFFPAPGPLPAGWTYNVRAPWLALAEGPDGSLILRDGAERHRFDRTAEGVWRIGAIERGGARITFARGPDGTLDRLDHPCGLVLRFANDAEGRRTGVTLVGSDGATSEILRYRYDARGNLLAADSTAGGSRFYEYDAADRCTFWRDDGRTWARHVYDGAGRVVRLETSGAWNGDTFTYDPERMRTRHTPGDRPDAFVWYGYDEEARIVAEEDAHGNVSRVLYDDSDQRIAEIDAEGRETRYAYDANGYLSAVTDPAGRTRRLFRDEAGHVVLRIDAPGEAWRFERDENGHLAAVVDPLDHRTDLSHDAAGRLLGTMRHDGLIERRRYDAGGRLSAIRDFRDGETRYEYDAFGRVTAIEDPLGARTTFAYAPGGDFWVPARETRADGVTLERQIDRGRAEVALTDGEGRRTIRRYGAYGVLEEIEDPQGGRVRFTYDGRKQLTRVTNALGRHWTFTRDACGRVVSETDFDGRTTAYAYDRSGRLTGRTEADGTRLAYAYDAAGLLLAETVSAADGSAPQVTRFAYDRAGRLVRAQNREARVALERDALGQVVAETVNERRIDSTYDCCGHRTARTGLGAAVASAYDPLGALSELRIGEHAPLRLFYDAAGRETQRESGRGFVLASGHDPAGRLMRQVAGRRALPGAAPEPALERVYGWNRASEPVLIADGRWGTTGYRYDGNGQVEEARHGDGLAERFDYDAALNVSAFQEVERGPGGPVQAASFLEAAPDTRLRFWHGS